MEDILLIPSEGEGKGERESESESVRISLSFRRHMAAITWTGADTGRREIDDYCLKTWQFHLVHTSKRIYMSL